MRTGKRLVICAVSLLVPAIVAGFLAARWWRGPTEAVPRVLPPEFRKQTREKIPKVEFTEISAQAGIVATHFSGAYGEKLLPETLGGGCAFFDFDNDEDQDVLLVSGRPWPWHDYGEARRRFRGSLTLYENDGTGKFSDVTQECGLGDLSFFGMGVAIGDYDNDGWTDFFVTAVGPNRLFRNLGGKFQDVTQQAGVAGASDAWGTACSFLDYDRDGWLDLFVCNYVQWSRELDLSQGFVLTGLGRAYGPPFFFAGTFPYLYRNRGDGTFEDVSTSAGVQVRNPATGEPRAKSLGVRPCDVDRDGWIDILVANDTVQNFLFLNQRDGTFKEIGMEAGIAFGSDGRARGAMGIDAAFYRNDECLGIVIGNFANEMSALFVSLNDMMIFSDEAIAAGIGPLTRQDLTFGSFFFDYDLDGRLDIFSVNGHLEAEINTVQESQTYRQAARLFWNAGPEAEEEFALVDASSAGAALFEPIVGRGAAYADIDGDGDLDLLATQIDGPPKLWRNELNGNPSFLRLKLVGTDDNRSAIGALVVIESRFGRICREVMPTRSYLSQVELLITVGGLSPSEPFKLTVVWPNGTQQEISDLSWNSLNILVQPRSKIRNR